MPVNLDPKKSLCFNCKYGLCMLQESEVHIEGELPPGLQEESPGEQTFLELPESHQHEHSFSETKVCALCYWAAPNVKLDSPIILTASVLQCSRYSKRGKNE